MNTKPSQGIETTPSGGLAVPARITQATAVEQARAVAEAQASVVVAQQAPRDLTRVWAQMREACSTRAVAERAFYSVPNRGNGASVHLARELARIWGNLQYAVRELRRDDDARESEIEAFAWDLQANTRVARTFQVPHMRMKGRERQPLIDLSDIYANNQNTGARAVRECIFAVLPDAFVHEAQQICQQTLQGNGDGASAKDQIPAMVAAFKDLGVTLKQLETRTGRKRSQWDEGDVAQLRIDWQSIHGGETTADALFGPDDSIEAQLQANAQPDDGQMFPTDREVLA